MSDSKARSLCAVRAARWRRGPGAPRTRRSSSGWWTRRSPLVPLSVATTRLVLRGVVAITDRTQTRLGHSSLPDPWRHEARSQRRSRRPPAARRRPRPRRAISRSEGRRKQVHSRLGGRGLRPRQCGERLKTPIAVSRRASLNATVWRHSASRRGHRVSSRVRQHFNSDGRVE
jgi:hypothetical protein